MGRAVIKNALRRDTNTQKPPKLGFSPEVSSGITGAT